MIKISFKAATRGLSASTVLQIGSLRPKRGGLKKRYRGIVLWTHAGNVGAVDYQILTLG